MPTPPKETIGGRKLNENNSFEFHKLQYDYIVKLTEYSNSDDFLTLSMAEKVSISQEIDEQTIAYERLRERIDNY